MPPLCISAVYKSVDVNVDPGLAFTQIGFIRSNAAGYTDHDQPENTSRVEWKRVLHDLHKCGDDDGFIFIVVKD
jgi:hypothetical protein